MPCVEITGWWHRGLWRAVCPNSLGGSGCRWPAVARWWFLALVLLFAPLAQAGQELLSQTQWATTQVDLLPAQALSLDYRAVDRDALNLGPFRGQIWLRLHLDGRAMSADRWLSVRWPYFRDFRVYQVGPTTSSGRVDLIELHDSPLPDGTFSMPNYPGRLLPAFQGEREFLIHLRSDGPAALRLTLSSLAEERQRALVRHLLFGAYLGAMLGMALYTLFLMLAVRDRTYLGYAVFLAAAALYVTLRYDGITPLWLDMLDWLPPTGLVQLAVAPMVLAGLWFIRRFLRTAGDDRPADRLLVGIMMAALLSIPASIWLAGVVSFLFVAGYVLASMVAVAWAAWRAMRRGFVPALYLLLAWAVFAVAVLLYLAMLLGLIPYAAWLTVALPVGSVAEAVLIAYALGSRMRHKQREERVLTSERDRYRLLSEQDGLTELFNRRALDRRLKDAIGTARSSKTPLSLIVLDADHFKDYNDRHGHLAGDDALRCLARVIRINVRQDDMCFRYGGEEFVVVLPGQDRAHAVVVAERIREAYFRSSISNLDAAVTVSLGVAEFREGDTPEILLARGDAALYRAKERGRDRVELAH